MPEVEVIEVPSEGAAESLSAALDILAEAIADRLIERAREGVAREHDINTSTDPAREDVWS